MGMGMGMGWGRAAAAATTIPALEAAGRSAQRRRPRAPRRGAATSIHHAASSNQAARRIHVALQLFFPAAAAASSFLSMPAPVRPAVVARCTAPVPAHQQATHAAAGPIDTIDRPLDPARARRLHNTHTAPLRATCARALPACRPQPADCPRPRRHHPAHVCTRARLTTAIPTTTVAWDAVSVDKCVRPCACACDEPTTHGPRAPPPLLAAAAAAQHEAIAATPTTTRTITLGSHTWHDRCDSGRTAAAAVASSTMRPTAHGPSTTKADLTHETQTPPTLEPSH